REFFGDLALKFLALRSAAFSQDRRREALRRVFEKARPENENECRSRIAKIDAADVRDACRERAARNIERYRIAQRDAESFGHAFFDRNFGYVRRLGRYPPLAGGKCFVRVEFRPVRDGKFAADDTF